MEKRGDEGHHAHIEVSIETHYPKRSEWRGTTFTLREADAIAIARELLRGTK